jgi:hypothetical protein
MRWECADSIRARRIFIILVIKVGYMDAISFMLQTEFLLAIRRGPYMTITPYLAPTYLPQFAELSTKAKI